MSDILHTGRVPDTITFAQTLSKGLSQPTTNLVAGAMQLSPRSLIQDESRQAYEAWGSHSSVHYNSQVFPTNAYGFDDSASVSSGVDENYNTANFTNNPGMPCSSRCLPNTLMQVIVITKGFMAQAYPQKNTLVQQPTASSNCVPSEESTPSLYAPIDYSPPPGQRMYSFNTSVSNASSAPVIYAPDTEQYISSSATVNDKDLEIISCASPIYHL